jgi:hypothetical protein
MDGKIAKMRGNDRNQGKLGNEGKYPKRGEMTEIRGNWGKRGK